MVNELTKVKKCYGCGALLQSSNEEELGYVPLKHLESDDIFLCQRCFKTHHYSADKLSEPTISVDFFEIIKDIRKKKALVFYVVDVFTFESSFNSDINSALDGVEVILIANKVDLLPKSTNKAKLLKFVERHVEEAGLHVSKVILTSSKKNYNIDEVIEEINRLNENRDVYFIGAVSSGKSLLIKTLLKNYKNETSRYITTSVYPNTTVAVQQIPISEKTTIFDTPGISITNSLISKVEKPVIKQIVPRGEIKARTYQLFSKNSIIIGGLARLDFLDGPFTSFTFYFSDDVKITRSFTASADHSMDSLIKNKKITPLSNIVTSVKDFDAFEFTTHEDRKYDIAWNGYGFVSFKGSGRKVRIFAPRGVAISYNESKI